MSQLFRLKSLDRMLVDAERGQSLKRTLGPFQLTILGIGAIVGAGIFSTIGTAAAGGAGHTGAGPALVVSFMLTAIVCGFAALCYAEFAAMVPISGSAYTYAYATLGELVAWIIGWDLIIEYAVGNVAVAISWSGYFQELLRNIGVGFPPWLGTDYRSAATAVGRVAEATSAGLDPRVTRPGDHPGGAGAHGGASPRRHPGRLQPARVPHRDARHLGARDRHQGERLGQRRGW